MHPEVERRYAEAVALAERQVVPELERAPVAASLGVTVWCDGDPDDPACPVRTAVRVSRPSALLGLVPEGLDPAVEALTERVGALGVDVVGGGWVRGPKPSSAPGRLGMFPEGLALPSGWGDTRFDALVPGARIGAAGRDPHGKPVSDGPGVIGAAAWRESDGNAGVLTAWHPFDFDHLGPGGYPSQVGVWHPKGDPSINPRAVGGAPSGAWAMGRRLVDAAFVPLAPGVSMGATPHGTSHPIVGPWLGSRFDLVGKLVTAACAESGVSHGRVVSCWESGQDDTGRWYDGAILVRPGPEPGGPPGGRASVVVEGDSGSGWFAVDAAGHARLVGILVAVAKWSPFGIVAVVAPVHHAFSALRVRLTPEPRRYRWRRRDGTVADYEAASAAVQWGQGAALFEP